MAERSSLRDNQLRFRDWFNAKQDQLPWWYSVICDRYGSYENDDPDAVWADYGTRMVWNLPLGATAPGQTRCVRIPRPQIGLGVKVGFLSGNVEPEVLEDAEFLRNIAAGNQSWIVTIPGDEQPGGRQVVWADSRVIAPLATYPGTGLSISIADGFYPYNGERKFYGGIINYPLADHQPSSGEWRLVGFYIDAANTFQAINGTAVATTIMPPEPVWPAGAFRLSVVRVANPQTSAVFGDITDPANDIFDRRMAWSDENGASGWPYATIITVDPADPAADYATIQDAIDNASGGETILIGPGTYTEALTVDMAVTLASLSPANTIIVCSTSEVPTVQITAAGVGLRNLTVKQLATVGSVVDWAITWGVDDVVLDNLIVECSANGAATTKSAYGLYQTGGDNALIRYCIVTALSSSTAKAYRNDSGDVTARIVGGRFDGADADISVNSATGATVITLEAPLLANNFLEASSGSIVGNYLISGGIRTRVDGQSSYGLLTYGISGASNPPVFLGQAIRGTQASPTDVQENDVLFFLLGQGYGNGAIRSSADIRFIADENWTSSYGSRISFFTTNDGGTSRAERMRLANGSLGIGAIDPFAKLAVHLASVGGGFFVTEANNVNTTAVVLVPNGTPDVANVVYFFYAAVDSAGEAPAGATSLINGATLTVSTGGFAHGWQFRVNADGSFDIRRTVGTRTLKVVVAGVFL